MIDDRLSVFVYDVLGKCQLGRSMVPPVRFVPSTHVLIKVGGGKAASLFMSVTEVEAQTSPGFDGYGLEMRRGTVLPSATTDLPEASPLLHIEVKKVGVGSGRVPITRDPLVRKK
ncbi:hypothetical protein FQA47_008054 [Oryzias melastigma]|uniref:Uncharacterized protein n=1 Tax=Oryzias melastigma TaxID=30732 RepID=A0A834CHF7_ORYME|nr:hypothetical protein FQA47_008054 [Oryzias melastigma]